MAKAQSGQSIFDITNQNFGTLDNLVTLSNDNGLSLSDNLFPGTELVIDNSTLGIADVKKEISDSGTTFGNNYSVTILDWILAEGIWNDGGKWIDTETWID
jgi:hypothetical protein